MRQHHTDHAAGQEADPGPSPEIRTDDPIDRRTTNRIAVVGFAVADEAMKKEARGRWENPVVNWTAPWKDVRRRIAKEYRMARRALETLMRESGFGEARAVSFPVSIDLLTCWNAILPRRGPAGGGQRHHPRRHRRRR
ncbi:hypothetical protein GCM10023191_056430 [Actinoallomurus oryzae]|uniref:Mutator family transposase n=2 Tax=Actinoallomurus oryzae TaxID=502180 RepID=A0ABP8QK15_9ACTN